MNSKVSGDTSPRVSDTNDLTLAARNAFTNSSCRPTNSGVSMSSTLSKYSGSTLK